VCKLFSDKRQATEIMSTTIQPSPVGTSGQSPIDSVQNPALAGFVAEVADKAESLGPAGRKVAAFFQANVARLADLTITDIARAAEVSEPTVGRICQALGFSGFRDFRIKLARASGMSVGHIPADVAADDRPADVARKVIDQSFATLQRLREQIQPQAVTAAVDLMWSAKRIEFYGHGNSGIVAMDAQHKFFRLGIPSIAYTDSHIHAMSAALLSPQDTVLAISRSGRTTELVRTTEILRERQTSIVSITPNGSPLARLATVNLHVDFDEDPDVYTPMSSRLGQLMVVDILAVAVAVRRGALSSVDMTRARDALREKRL
jgi:RpiR family transcriptional regulator, carbohydrate utilization regulator